MGCDIHWVIERKHKDGGWEAVISDTGEFARDLKENGYNFNFDDPSFIFGMRSYQFFGALSGVRQNEEGATIATPGMPEDISEHSSLHLEWNDPVDRHSHGWCSLAGFRDAASGAFATEALGDEEVREIVAFKLQQLEAVLARFGEEGPTRILRGRSIQHEPEVYFPDMALLSNHEKLELIERAKGFEPMSGETVRLLFAYDN